MSEAHIIPLRTYYLVFWALMALLVATVGGSYLPLGPLHVWTALAIATAKAVLIMLYFMHVRYSNKLTWIFSSVAFLWLGIMFVFLLSDYFTRGMLHIDGK